MRQPAVLAIQTGVCDPLDPHPISNFHVLLCALTHGHHDTSTFMTANQRKLRRCRPVAQQSMQVGMAHTRVQHTNEYLAGVELGLLDVVNLFDRDLFGTTVFVKDGDSILGGYVELSLS